MLSRIALPSCFLTIWVESFDYMTGENEQLKPVLVLVRSPPARGRIRCSSWARWRLLPAASLSRTRKALLHMPALRQHSTDALTGCQHSQNRKLNLSQNRNTPEGGGEQLQCCNPGKSQCPSILLLIKPDSEGCSLLHYDCIENFSLSFGLAPGKMNKIKIDKFLQ